MKTIDAFAALGPTAAAHLVRALTLIEALARKGHVVRVPGVGSFRLSSRKARWVTTYGKRYWLPRVEALTFRAAKARRTNVEEK